MNVSFRVNVVVTTNTGVFERPQEFTPNEWRRAAADALASRDRLLGAERCMINPNVIADPRSPEEHVIPQGTGIRWIKLPQGATSAVSNGNASAWEKMFLRDGMMGALRPFFVSGRKSVTFGDTSGRHVVFRNDPDRGFIIETHDLETLPDIPTGAGSLQFLLPVVQAPTLHVSRALHKIAYLTLGVIEPALAFSSALDQVREYLCVEKPSYRSYGERFRPGSAPGAAVAFYLRGSHLSGNKVGGDQAVAVIRIHHAEYVVPLLGPIPDTVPSPGLTWYPDPTPVGRKKVALELAFDDLRGTA